MKKKSLLAFTFVIVAIVIVGTITAFMIQRAQYKTVSVEVKAAVTVHIYDADTIEQGEHDVTGEETSNPTALFTLTSSQDIKLKAGEYVAQSQATNDYAETNVGFTVEDKPKNVVVDPEFSRSKLEAELNPQKAVIATAITTAFPQAKTLYRIENGNFFQKGEWYGTKLTYVGPAGQYPSDTLRVIVHREGDTWKVVTNPPQIVISAVLHPSIPQSVVSAINNDYEQ